MKENYPVLTVNELKEVLKKYFINPNLPQTETQTIPLIWGLPGIGKSYIIYEIAKELNGIVIPYFASGEDETEIRGIPVPVEKENVVKYMPLEHQKFPKDKIVIWFWDEINRARPEVIQALFSILSTFPRRIGTHIIPPNVYIVLSANEGDADSTLVTDFNDASFYNKLSHIKVKFNKKEYLSYLSMKYNLLDTKSKKTNLQIAAERVVNFLSYRNQSDFLTIPDNPSRKKSYPTPRTIERFILTFRDPIAKYNPNSSDSEKIKEEILLGACLVGNSWVADFTIWMKENLNKSRDDINIYDIYNNSLDDDNIFNELQERIKKLDSDRVLKLSAEIKDLFNDEEYDDLRKNVDERKLLVFAKIINRLPLDSKKGLITELVEIPQFVNISDELSSDKDSELAKLLESFIQILTPVSESNS